MAEAETRSCVSCNTSFTIEPEDFAFYQKIDVPAPTRCSNCRNQRRLAWRNDRSFYARACDKTGNQFISIYAPEKPYTVYEPDAWYGDDWNPLSYGREFDFSRPFFEQFAELQRVVPRLGIDIVNCENSYFCNYCGDDRNCYLDIAGEANEDCYFNLFTKYSKDCVDCTFAYHSTLCYETISAENGYNLSDSMYADDSSNLVFCFDAKVSRDSLFSANLRQKQYAIFNQVYPKGEFEQQLAGYDFGSYTKRQEYLAKWRDWQRQHAIYRAAYLTNCENSSGNDLRNCKNVQQSFNAAKCEDSKYLYDVLDAKDCQDLNYSLYKPELAYELISTLSMNRSAFCMASHYCRDSFYSELCNNSNDLFGCIGLRHKQYCILNKQYSKEEYESLKAQITEHMKATGEWGEFFPASISPWGYNETVANEYFPLNQSAALQHGFTWYERPDQPAAQPQTYVVPDHIRDADESILSQVLTCANCEKNYKIIPHELAYYQRQTLPIPRKCPDCRHRDRLKLRAPRQLYDRACTNCQASIQSPYAADRPERVYCDACYLKVVV